jgi:hypothetical protein
MANQVVAPAAPAAQGVKSAAPASIKLPEAFQPKAEPSTPAPELDAFSELEQADARNPSPDSRPPKRQPEQEKPAAKPEPKTEKAPEASQKAAMDKTKEDAGKEQAANDKKTPDADSLAPDDPTKKFQLASELRRDYRRIHAELERATAELKQAKNSKPEATEERKAQDSRFQALEKRNKELEEEISYRDYTKSSEFEQKFKKPFETKLARVYSQIGDLSVTLEDGTERPATREDFDKVLEASQSNARAIAKQLFGDQDFREVLQYRRELNELQQNADTEVKTWREKAKERQDQESAHERQQREQAETVFRKSHDNYVQKYPDWFGPVEGDDELNSAMTKGLADVDKSQDRSLPLDQRLDKLAATRLKAASFGRHVITIKRLKEENAELKESLKAYQASEPGEGKGQKSAPNGKHDDDDLGSAMDEIDAADRRNPAFR